MADKTTIGIYADKHQDYADLPVTREQQDALEMFCDGLPEDADVFDLGCGPGVQAAELLGRGLTVSGLDATPEFVAAARAKGIDARLGTFDDLTEVDAYDGIFASFSLLHAPKAAFPRYLTACHTALRTGGRLFLGLKLGQGESRDAIGRFYSYYSEDELRTIFERRRLHCAKKPSPEKAKACPAVLTHLS